MGLGRIQTLFLRHVTSALPTEPLEKNFLLVRHRDFGAALCLWRNFMNAELTWFHYSSYWKLFGDTLILQTVTGCLSQSEGLYSTHKCLMPC